MSQAVDIESWRQDGERLWAAIQAHRLVVIPWNNPWRRIGLLSVVLLAASLGMGLLTSAYWIAALLGVICAGLVYTAIKYYRIGVQTGGLYSFFAEHGFGIGCDADRLLIPYSSISVPAVVNPGTVNDNYIILPVVASSEGVLVEQKAGSDLPWDGKPYTRGIASVLIKDGALRVCAYLNEMIVHLFCAIYPLSIYLSRREDTGAPATG